MGPLHLGVVSAICAVAVASEHQLCMICTAHNLTHFQTEHRQAIPPKRQGSTGYTPPSFAQLLAYGEDCSDSLILGEVLSAQEVTSGRLTGLDDAFTLLAFSRCLIRALEFAQTNVSHRFTMANNTLQLCANITLTESYLTINTPWFISPGAIRWATIICSLIAVLRALYG
ncbi:ORF4' protein [Zambian malbrouck virus 1]|uniref:ORF4' protein n=1 Tax=Zambian malbrouck virus 1 TaxID=2682610 RepID=A0A167L777_9NIDO|nr:ORF4' protein [Zambian malbrouck virus 1]ANB32505.1 ORF4' protein [Zambian malbrouck virus 1]